MSVVLISGGTGLVGSNLTRHLLDRNHTVIILTREKNRDPDNANVRFSYWNVAKNEIDPNVIREADHIIHLAGAGVMDQRWTAEYKKTIVESRVSSASLLLKALTTTANNVQTFITASAIGYYGKDPAILVSKDGFPETSVAPDNFLAQTVLQWEAASEPVKSSGIRWVALRQGIILANEGGAFKEYKKPLRFGMATIFGKGRQIVSWIHIDDVSRMYCDAIENQALQGAYNAVAPQPVSQKKLMLLLAEKMRGRFFTTMHVPEFALKMVLGKRSVEILKSATVSDRKIKSSGFTFLFPTIEAALDDLAKSF